MPYVSPKRRRFFKLCEHNPQHATGQCPDQATLAEFSAADKAEGGGSGGGVRGKLMARAKAKKRRK